MESLSQLQSMSDEYRDHLAKTRSNWKWNGDAITISFPVNPRKMDRKWTNNKKGSPNKIIRGEIDRTLEDPEGKQSRIRGWLRTPSETFPSLSQSEKALEANEMAQMWESRR